MGEIHGGECVFLNYLCISQIQLRPAPLGYCGAFARLVSPGGGAFANFVLPGPRAFCQLRSFNTHTISYQKITTQRILLEKQADWLIVKDGKKEVCKGMFSILCMHFFIAYQARIRQRNSGAIDVNIRFYGYSIKFLLILFEEHHFIFTKLLIAVNFAAHY